MRGSCRFPGPRPGARLVVVTPLRWVGCGGSGGEGGRVAAGAAAVVGVVVREEERECLGFVGSGVVDEGGRVPGGR